MPCGPRSKVPGRMESPSAGRRELLDHVIALNERHLKRLLSEYVSYHHEHRTHLGLRKETPGCRIRSAPTGPVICHARLVVSTIAMTARPETRRFPLAYTSWDECRTFGH